jgi:hypothetical protein
MCKSLAKEILCEIIKDINSYINIKWTGKPMTVKEIEQIFYINKKN